MGKVYLLANEEWTQFKIGITNNSSTKRIKSLQTGNGSEISIVKEFDTNNARKIESNLHRRYKPKQLVGEWFSLNDDDIRDFESICTKLDDDINFLLEHNPFYK